MAINYDALNKLKNLNSLKAKVDGVPSDRRLSKLKIDSVVSTKQVRTQFDDIENLAQSLREIGQQSPILVKPQNADGKYVILQGERRWRAAKLAGFTEIEAIILEKDVTELDRILGQLTENLQRDEMKPLEIAEAFAELKELGLKQKEIAERLGLSKNYVSLYMSLMKMPADLVPLSREGIVRDGWAFSYLMKAYNQNSGLTLALIERTKEQEENIITRVGAKRILDRVTKREEKLNEISNEERENREKAAAAVKAGQDLQPTDPVEALVPSLPENDEDTQPTAETPTTTAAPASPEPVRQEPRFIRSYEERIPPHKMGEGCARIAFGDRLHVKVSIFSKFNNEATLEHGYLTPNVRPLLPKHICVTVNGEIRSVPNDEVNIIGVIPASEIPDAEL